MRQIRLRIEIGEVSDYIYYPDGRIVRSNGLAETNSHIKSWTPSTLSSWQKFVVWALGAGPVEIVNSKSGARVFAPPKWILGGD